MCGRFSQSVSIQRVRELTEIAGELALPPRYNVTPGVPVAAIVQPVAGENHWAVFLWGLIPSWAKDRKIASHTINAKAETVAEKPAFRAAFKRRRCVIPVDGFYEWHSEGGAKQPYFIRRQDHDPLLLAGLWEHWEHEEAVIQSCTVITTEANDLVGRIHHRMPVILPWARLDDWLDPQQQDVAALQGLLKAFDARQLELYPVDRRVNNPRFDDPHCITPLT